MPHLTIGYSPLLPPFTPTQAKRLETGVKHSMENSGCVSSASGMSAVIAIHWCIQNGKGFKLESAPDGSYHVVTKIEPVEIRLVPKT